MAVVRIPDQNVTLRDRESVTSHLASVGIHYEHWELPRIADSASSEELLSAFGKEIDRLKARGGYQTADVIDVNPATPGLETMLAKFNSEHWHEEDEVRFIVDGRGLFHIHPENGPLTAIEVEAGDLICVPRKTRHWFDLCGDRRIRAIRQAPTSRLGRVTLSAMPNGSIRIPRCLISSAMRPGGLMLCTLTP